MSWTLIEHQALTSSAASVTLGSGGTIPQTYKTLKLVVSARSDGGGGQMFIGFNGSTSNFTRRNLVGTGSAAQSFSASDNEAGQTNDGNQTASTFASNEITIPNYAGSSNKPISTDAVYENNGTTAYQYLGATLWSQTAAITSIYLKPTGTNSFVSGCTFTLYGLK